MAVKLNIEGMMCEHCTSRVQKELASVRGVQRVDVSLEDKCATVYGNKFKQNALVKAVQKAGYTVTEVTEQ